MNKQEIGRQVGGDSIKGIARKTYKGQGWKKEIASRLLQVARVDEDVSIISLDFAQTRPQRRESTIEDKATFHPLAKVAGEGKGRR